MTLDERIEKLQLENEALRNHLRLALSTIRDPIPEILYLPPDEEEIEIKGEWDEDIFERYDEWDDCWTVLGDEVDCLAMDVAKWRDDIERDLREWNTGDAAVLVEVLR